MDSRNTCLIITGCIESDKSVPLLFLRDENERRKQYIQSIRFYLKKTNISNIVFCDNSNAEVEEDLIDLAKSLGKNFEWIRFQGDVQRCIKQGKGYGEGEILEYAIEHSTIIKNCETIIKVTGRLIVKNIKWIMRLIKSGKIYIYPITESKGKKSVCTRFYVMPKKRYKNHFINLYEKVDDVNYNYIEHIFAETIQEQKIPTRLFPLYPDIAGISGSSGEVYNNTKIKQIWYTIRMHLPKR